MGRPETMQVEDMPVWRHWIAQVAKSAPIYLVLVVLLVWISFLNPRFFEPQVFMSFLMRAAPLMILAAGQLFVVVSGGFDLSVGSLITLVVLGGALMAGADPAATWWVIGVLFLIGTSVGLFNGVVVSYLRVPSIITTLGMLLTLKGAALLWSGGSPRGHLPDNFRMFGRGRLEGVPFVEQVPYAVIILLVVGFAAILLMHYTNFGRQLFMVGDNPRTAALSGVNIPKVRIIAFLVSALSAVIAGILLGGFSGVSVAVGEGYELQAISAVVLGGAQLLGGRGSMPAAMAGALTLAALFMLLNLLGLPSPLRLAVQGFIIISAVAYASFRESRLR